MPKWMRVIDSARNFGFPPENEYGRAFKRALNKNAPDSAKEARLCIEELMSIVSGRQRKHADETLFVVTWRDMMSVLLQGPAPPCREEAFKLLRTQTSDKPDTARLQLLEAMPAFAIFVAREHEDNLNWAAPTVDSVARFDGIDHLNNALLKFRNAVIFDASSFEIEELQGTSPEARKARAFVGRARTMRERLKGISYVVTSFYDIIAECVVDQASILPRNSIELSTMQILVSARNFARGFEEQRKLFE